MNPNVNEVHKDEEDVSKEEDEEFDCDKEVVQTWAEGNIITLGSMKDVIES